MERDETMIVTMTAGQLYDLVSKAATAAAEKAVGDILRHIAAADARAAGADVLVGGEAIARAIGVNRNTMYKLRREGCLGDAVRRMGNGKLMARRSELLDAIAENTQP